MKTKRKPIWLLIAALALGASFPIRAQSAEPTLKEMKTKIQSDCKSDIQQFCNTVVPGQGRMADCLNQNESSLSGGCKKTWTGAKENISKRMDKAQVAFRKDCGTDVQQYCSNVPSGKGRLLDCLSQHSGNLSNACTQFFAKLDQKLNEFLG